TGQRLRHRRTALIRLVFAGRLLTAYLIAPSDCSSTSSQIAASPAQSPVAQPCPGQTRSQANRPAIGPLVPSRHVTFRRGIRAARSFRLTGRGEPSASRRRFCGRPPVPAFGSSHVGSSVKTTIRSEEHTSELQSLAYLVC